MNRRQNGLRLHSGPGAAPVVGLAIAGKTWACWFGHAFRERGPPRAYRRQRELTEASLGLPRSSWGDWGARVPATHLAPVTVPPRRVDLDNLIALLDRLVDAGNTVVVVEHNLDVVKRVDWVIDLGPEAGRHGGQVIFEATPA